jgi:hypothetical protein
MTSAVIQALAKDDIQDTSDAGFYAENDMDMHSFSITVEEVGTLSMPLTQDNIAQLLRVASPAHFGLGEKTLLDKKVRDTQEIAAHKLQVNYDEKIMRTMLENMRDVIGLPKNATLTPHLHNLLVYGPGQFFKPHQDSEKIEGMIATLILVLPFPHIGGDLVIEHTNKKHIFKSENLQSNLLRAIIFYADCHHQIKKVTQGYRVALTYNVVLSSTVLQDQKKKYTNPKLENALRDYFSLTPPLLENTFLKNSPEEEEKPKKLVYFLDHSYTEHSLNWNFLKGVDALNAQAFRSAAETLGLIPHLALVEIHQSWITDGDENDPEPEELIDSGTTFNHWVGSHNQKLSYDGCFVSDSEICWTKELEEKDLVESEYEGWMGNYGHTIDYWYRRAAIVLWRKTDQLAMYFKLDHDQALAELLASTQKQGQEKYVIDTIQQAGSSLYGSLRSQATAQDFKQFVQIAVYIQNDKLAESILSHFSIKVIEITSVEEIVKLQHAYGVAWCLTLMSAWAERNAHWYSGRNPAPENINSLLRRLLSLKVDMKLALFLLSYSIESTIAQDAYLKKSTPLELAQSLKDRLSQLAEIIGASSLVDDQKATEKLVQHIISNPSLYPADALVDMVIEMRKKGNHAFQLLINLVEKHIASSIREELDKGLRTEDDWSIDAKPKCNCEYCKITIAFVKSKIESSKIWPIAQTHRDHIISIFRELGLPISFSHKKEGSPHKLVMIKSDQLYLEAKTRYEKMQSYEKLLNDSEELRVDYS